jgi:hypothetical protein
MRSFGKEEAMGKTLSDQYHLYVSERKANRRAAWRALWPFLIGPVVLGAVLEAILPFGNGIPWYVLTGSFGAAAVGLPVLFGSGTYIKSEAAWLAEKAAFESLRSDLIALEAREADMTKPSNGQK